MPINLQRAHVRVLITLFLLFAFNAQLSALTLPAAAPAAVKMDAQKLVRIDDAVNGALVRKELPGAVVLVARRGRVVWRKAYGARAVLPAREAMTIDTIFDLASLTKIIATTTSIMILVERGLVRLNDPITKYIPEIKGEGSDRVTIERLLTHTSGYAPDFDLSKQWSGYDEALQQLYSEPLRNTPGARFVYSDINFIALGEIVRRVSGMPLDEFARKNIYEPLGMKDTSFRPSASLTSRIAPTETRRATASYLGGKASDAGTNGERWMRGEVHDPTAYRMNGVAGHAGLFSTADDLAIFCQMILQGGEYNGARILSPLTVAMMTRPRAVSIDGAARGLGWDIASGFSSNRGDLFPLGSFGHTGFTGTSIWIDPLSETFVIFLSNRVHPDGKGDVTALRGRVASIVAGAIEDAQTARVRESEAMFASELAASALRFNAARARGGENLSSNVNVPDARVLTGIDVLERDGYKQLAGMRLGLITNHTGRDRAGRQTIDVLREAANVKLTALFSPEHGIRGVADEKVADSRDEKTGLPIYSLYGETRRPKPEQLENLDALVYDIQDVGARFYTYISTLGYAMEEAARAHIPLFVLDRPNPINGVEVEGPVADEDKLSFTAYHTIPVRHGMTVGELATLYNNERKIGCDLRVIKIENWQRAMWFDQTNLTWVNPSPNMRSLTEAALYPGIGLLETTNLSVGRGTDTPFELIGAPYIDGQKLAARLNKRNLAGVRFVPVRYTPSASVFKGENCGGINIIITDRAAFQPMRTGLEIAASLRALYPNEWKIENYNRLLVNSDTLERLQRNEGVDEIMRSWQARLNDFKNMRARALLYK